MRNLLSLEQVLDKYLEILTHAARVYPPNITNNAWSELEGKFIDPARDYHFKTWCKINGYFTPW